MPSRWRLRACRAWVCWCTDWWGGTEPRFAGARLRVIQPFPSRRPSLAGKLLQRSLIRSGLLPWPLFVGASLLAIKRSPNHEPSLAGKLLQRSVICSDLLPVPLFAGASLLAIRRSPDHEPSLAGKLLQRSVACSGHLFKPVAPGCASKIRHAWPRRGAVRFHRC